MVFGPLSSSAAPFHVYRPNHPWTKNLVLLVNLPNSRGSNLESPLVLSKKKRRVINSLLERSLNGLNFLPFTGSGYCSTNYHRAPLFLYLIFVICLIITFSHFYTKKGRKESFLFLSGLIVKVPWVISLTGSWQIIVPF